MKTFTRKETAVITERILQFLAREALRGKTPAMLARERLKKMKGRVQ